LPRGPAAIAALLLALWPVVASAADTVTGKAPVKAPVKLTVGDLAPQFVRSDLQGQVFDLKAQRGKIVLIDFWASWCPPCIEEIPHLSQLQKQYGRSGFEVVGISMDDSSDTTRKTMRTIAFDYPVVAGDAKFGNLYGGVLGLPLQYLVGGDGRILAIWSGEVALPTLDKAIAAALKKARPS
jgi:thiol-disulfide isomerase/thioredoxin